MRITAVRALGRIGGAVCVSLWWPAMYAASSSLSAQTLQITSPSDGSVANSGQPLTVTVAASPDGAFQFVALMTDLPLASDPVLAAPPYQFTIQIQPDAASRRYTITAIGVAGSTQAAVSAPVSIQVERPDTPRQLTAEPSTLSFDYVSEGSALIVYGSFSDGSTVDLTDSSLITYSSDTPGIVTADNYGVVTAVGPGSANVLVTYAGTTIQVPAEVPQPV
ncbi:MAG: Ig-like domain-containing protein [Bryobacteraceae bacterium]